MKTSELVTKLVDMGLETTRLGGFIRVLSDFSVLAEVSTEEMYQLDTFFVNFKKIDEDIKRGLIKVLFEYAMTPLEEREEKKRYKYRLKDIADKMAIFYIEERYLNYSEREQEFWLYDSRDVPSSKTIFEENDPLLESVNLDMFDKIEVDEDGNAI